MHFHYVDPLPKLHLPVVRRCCMSSALFRVHPLRFERQAASASGACISDSAAIHRWMSAELLGTHQTVGAPVRTHLCLQSRRL